MSVVQVNAGLAFMFWMSVDSVFPFLNRSWNNLHWETNSHCLDPQHSGNMKINMNMKKIWTNMNKGTGCVVLFCTKCSMSLSMIEH